MILHRRLTVWYGIFSFCCQTPGYPDTTPGYPPPGQTPTCATPQFSETTPGFPGYGGQGGPVYHPAQTPEDPPATPTPTVAQLPGPGHDFTDQVRRMMDLNE